MPFLTDKKIFCIGFQRTGTTSLAAALTGLGYSVGYAGKIVNQEVDWGRADVDEQVWQKTV
ncbi:sulfotransferase, partial [Methylobrevis pamukkalensis]|uniref:sulfotransferase n=1 Tax=Methylobrevis pamukkalensis TaxID=1439726 RepID=UPI001AECDE95